MLVGPPCTVGEFDGMGLAEIDHPGGQQFPHQGCGPRGRAMFPRRAAAHCHLALDLDEILDRDGNAMERPDGMPGRDGLVSSFRGEAGVGAIDRNEGVQFGLQSLDARKALVYQVDRG